MVFIFSDIPEYCILFNGIGGTGVCAFSMRQIHAKEPMPMSSSACQNNNFTLLATNDHSMFGFAILLGSSGITIYSIYVLFVYYKLLYLALAIVSLVVCCLVGRFIFRSMPSKLEINGNTVCIHDVPFFWVEFERFSFPLFCRKRITLDREKMALEWIGLNLVWNDMEKGRSVVLVSRLNAGPVVSWLEQNGIPVPTFCD